MIPAISSLGLTPISQSRPAISHGANLGSLQQRDGFFSSTSSRAQLGQFLNKKTSKPFVVAYQAENTHGVWELLAPRKNHLSALLVQQHAPKSPNTKVGIAHNALPAPPPMSAAQKRVLDELIPRVGFASTQLEVAKGKNPFMTVPVGLQKASQVKPSPKTRVSISTYSGQRLDSVQSEALRQAFLQADKSPLKPGWVVQQGRQMTVLKQDDPRQAGYEKKPRPLASMMMRVVAKTASTVLGLPYAQDQLHLPNGATIATRKEAWVDGQDNRVNLFQAVHVPAIGTWLQLDEAPKTDTHLLKDRAKVMQSVETTLSQWQANRKEPLTTPQGFKASPFALAV